jgi:hypothetical protein
MRYVLLMLCFCVLIGFIAQSGCKKQEATDVGEDGDKLTLVRPNDMTLKQGAVGEIQIQTTRVNEEDQVTVFFSAMPQGVQIVNSDKVIVGDEAAYKVMVDESAALVENHEVTVTARAGTAEVEQMFRISIVDKDE